MTESSVKAKSKRPQYPRAIPFQLEDLKGQKQSYSFPRSQILVLAFADQKGSELMADWITPLYQRLGSTVEIQGVAELSAVPTLARGIARGIISSLVDQPIMLDWTGQVSRSFGARSGVTHLFVITPEGEIVADFAGSANPADLKALFQAIEAERQRI